MKTMINTIMVVDNLDVALSRGQCAMQYRCVQLVQWQVACAKAISVTQVVQRACMLAATCHAQYNRVAC